MGRARRGRGEGGVRQRANGLWEGVLSIGASGAGKRKRLSVYGKTKAEALKKLNVLRGQADAGTLADTGRMTVLQVLELWLSNLQGRVSQRSYEERESLVRVHLVPRIGGTKLARFKAIHVEALSTELRDDQVGPWAARNALDALDTAMRFAVKKDLIPANPFTKVDKPKPKETTVAFLTQLQSQLLRDLSIGAPAHALLMTALGTGCRSGELLALTWPDLDLKAGTLTVRRALVRARKSKFEVKEPKTKASRRTIALPTFVVKILVDLQEQRRAAGRLAHPVFSTRSGKYLNRSNVLRALRAITKKVNARLAEVDPAAAPVPGDVRFHDLRHTHASLLLSAGHSIRAVAQRLGHSSPAFTLKIYGHCLPGDDGRLAAGFQDLMG